jgi:hypothetical protein
MIGIFTFKSLYSNKKIIVLFSEIFHRSESKMMLDLVDAASLLSRLEMEGVQVGNDRWTQLVPVILRCIQYF